MSADKSVQVAIAQTEFTLDVSQAKLKSLVESAVHASQHGAQVVVFPELVISGYHARDLWLRKEFLVGCQKLLDDFCAATSELALVCVIGLPRWGDSGALMNSVVAVRGGKVMACHDKSALPNDGVFDERRYFQAPPKPSPCVFDVNGVRLGILVCEDIWHP